MQMKELQDAKVSILSILNEIRINIGYFLMLQCDYSNRATWNKVNQSENCLKTKDGNLFYHQRSLISLNKPTLHLV